MGEKIATLVFSPGAGNLKIQVMLNDRALIIVTKSLPQPRHPQEQLTHLLLCTYYVLCMVLPV